MNQHKFAFTFAWIAALLIATPAVAQLANHPIMALPAGPAAGATAVGGEFARGLNDDSGKQNSFGVGVVRAMERVSVMGMLGYVASDTDKASFGAAVAVHLLPDPDAVQVSIQSGIGFIKPDFGTESVTMLNFPIGIAISAAPSDADVSVRPWVMPRLHISRTGAFSTFESSTDTNFGVSGGISVTGAAGFGAHVSGDVVFITDEIAETRKPFAFSIGVHYNLPN